MRRTLMPFRARGFTLVEVLVAMTIMSLIAIMSWQGVDGIVRSRNISQARLESVLRLNTVLAQWEQDLQAFHDTSGIIARPLYFDGASLTLVRRAPDSVQSSSSAQGSPGSQVSGGAQGSPGLQVVVWSLRGSDLKRWAGPPVTTVRALQDQWGSSRQFIGTESGQLRVLSNVAQLQLYYYVESAWANAQSSADLPHGVRLVLTFSGADGLSGEVTRDIAMPPR